MAYKMVHEERGKGQGYCRKKYILDNEADVSALPKSCAGSVAIVAAGGKAFMVNASGEWVEFGAADYLIAEEASF